MSNLHVEACRKICYIHLCTVTALCLDFHVTSQYCNPLDFSIKKNLYVVRLLPVYCMLVYIIGMFCLELLLSILHLFHTNFTLISFFPNFLKERTVRETEIQTIQRKVRKFTDTLSEMVVVFNSIGERLHQFYLCLHTQQ